MVGDVRTIKQQRIRSSVGCVCDLMTQTLMAETPIGSPRPAFDLLRSRSQPRVDAPLPTYNLHESTCDTFLMIEI